MAANVNRPIAASHLVEAAHPASIDVRAAYSKDGYVLAKQIFNHACLAELCQTLRSALNKSLSDGPDHACSLDELILKCEWQDHDLVYKAAQSVGSSAVAYELLGSSGIIDMVSEITGFEKSELHVMPMYLIVQLPSDERFDYAWHQDGSYYPWCREFLTLWFPVNRGTCPDTGTISMIPGSHRSGSRETENYLRNGFFKQMQSKLQPGEADKEQMLEVELGDCCIMNGNTVHRSVANRSTSPRVAGVLRIAHLGADQTYERERFYCIHKS
jgi:hypothetical protein